jgi:(1->4)-alpha-D-glucan 1-alpha-D-glucosylmutase
MHIPKSTYRLQFNSSFGFTSAKNIIEYLSKLGISDIYASPIFKAKKDSTHGYDVVEPNLLNPQVGTDEEFDSLIREIKKYDIQWLQDFVPNHMAFNIQNRMLIDLLENGSNSQYADFFDIDWSHHHAGMQSRILAPFLGKFYQEALENGEIRLNYDEEGLSINYYETRLPIKIESYADVLSFRLDKLRNKLGRNDPEFIRYMGALFVVKSLPTAEEIDERYNQIKFLKGILWGLYTENYNIKDFIDENLKIFNGIKGMPESFDLMDKLLSQQNFRIAFWKVANEEINYRRFFNVNELISLRVENEDVFNRIHSLIFKLIKEDRISGLRIDHIDGLYDPSNYLLNLHERAKDIYLVVEKILEFEENLPAFWPVQGTTGYDYLNFLNEIFCQRKSSSKFSSFYNKFSGINRTYEQLVIEKKRLIIQTRMAGDVENLAILIEEISSKDRFGVDITLHGVKEALEEILTHFPIYRTYISSNKNRKTDRKYLSGVIEKVKTENQLLSKEFQFIGSLLTKDLSEKFTLEQKDKSLNFLMKFQQLTGPIMAKGFEDTVLYVFNRLVSLNEVGSNPNKFGISLTEFYNFNKKRFLNWRHTINTTSTHDTKRGEDVRARINVLSEMPEEWIKKVKTWNRINKQFKKRKNGYLIPDNNLEYFIYQTLIGSYPFNIENNENYLHRIKQYLIKSMREAKEHSSWTKPDAEYESAALDFVQNLFNGNNEFYEDFKSFQKKVAFYGVYNSLSQSIIKITSPGIPDFYQGTELWDLFLVDPDNRQAVNYNLRSELLEEIIEEYKKDKISYLKSLLTNPSDGKIKLFITYKGLQVRNNNLNIYNEGNFIPMDTGGKFKDNIIAFARSIEDKFIITVAPRFLAALVKEYELPIGTEIWKDTYIKSNIINLSLLKNNFTGETFENENKILVGEVFKDLPYGLLSN